MSKDNSKGEGRTAKGRPSASRSKTVAAKSAGSAQPVKKPAAKKTGRTRAGEQSGYLGVDDFKHFREVFKKQNVLGKEIVEDESFIPPLPTEVGPEQSGTPEIGKRRGRGPQKAPTKVLTSIRLDKNVYEYFKSSGRGWQSRINDMLSAQMQKEIRSEKRKARAAAKSKS